jgi:hypothetical protein
MNAGDILDQAFSLYRTHFLTLLGVVAVVGVPLSLLSTIGSLLTGGRLASLITGGGRTVPGLPPSEGPLLWLGLALVALSTLLGFVATILQSGALAVVISERYLGRAVTIRQAYTRSLRRWQPLLAMTLVELLAYIPLVAILVLPFALLIAIGGTGPSPTNEAATALLGLLTCGICVFLPVLLAVYFSLSVRWLFAAQTVVIEERGGLAALRRSWELVRGSFWRVLAIDLLLTILGAILTAGPVLAIQLAASLLPSFAIVTVANNIVSTALNIVVLPLQFAALTLLYFDLRIRREGFDLELLAQQRLTVAAAGAVPAW